MRKLSRVFMTFRAKVMVILILTMLFSAALSDFLIYNYSRKAQFALVQDKLLMIARTAVLFIDADELLRIPMIKEGMRTEYYQHVAERLRKIKEINSSIRYIYTMTKTEKQGILQFVVDPDATETDSYPGSEYNTASCPEMMRGFEFPSVDQQLNIDPWGAFLSGYAPIRDTDGTVVALLGVDMAANDIRAIEQEVMKRAAFVLVMGLIISIFIATMISKRVSTPINKLVTGISHIAQGDLDYRVAVKGRDEIAALAGAFNTMAADLKLYTEELKRTTSEKEQIESELRIARDIQTSMLPCTFPPFPDRREIDLFAQMDPAKEVGGDFYDFFFINERTLFVIIGDVSGKGIPAALFMAISRILFKTEALRGLSCDQILSRVNNIIQPDNELSMFITVFCMMVDVENGALEFSNAGHNPPLIYRGRGGFEFLEVPQGFVVGPIENTVYEARRMILKEGECIFLYTDGVTEAMSVGDQMFSEQRLKECLSEEIAKDSDVEKMILSLREQIRIFAHDAVQSDDITMVAFRYNGRPVNTSAS